MRLIIQRRRPYTLWQPNRGRSFSGDERTGAAAVAAAAADEGTLAAD